MNRNILDQIKNNHPHQSRYDIDRHLLQQGHDPAEIDHAWRQFQVQANRRSLKLASFKLLWSWPVRLGLIAVCLIYYSLSQQPGSPNYLNADRLPPTPTLRPETTPVNFLVSKEDYIARSIWASNDGGINWSQVYSGTNLQMLVCADLATCYAVDDTLFLRSTDGGKNWKVAGQLDASNWFGLNCPAAQYCYMLQQSGSTYFIKATSNGGESWTKVYQTVVQPLPTKCSNPGCSIVLEQPRRELRSMACPTVTTCYVTTERDLLTTNDSGQTWEHISIAGAGNNLSCPMVRICFVVSEQIKFVVVTTDGGRTWMGNRPPSLTSPRDNTTITCLTSSTCYISAKVAGDTYFLSGTKDGGASWQELLNWPYKDHSDRFMTNITCPDAYHCLFSDQTGHLLTTSDGWENWQSHQLNQPGLSRELTCPTTRVCFRLTT